MKIKGLGGVLVPVFLFACGGSSGGSGDSGTGPLLSVTVTSGGTVTSADGSINCTSSCSQVETAGAVVQLTATPAAGMQFTGWSGACSGTGACSITMNGDTTVGAAFAAQALVAIEVDVDGAGRGTVVSTPAGISCPGTCLMNVAPGTIVALTGTADANSHFDGYGGATCHGTSCNFTVSTAAKIFATFSSTLVTATHTLTVTNTGAGTVTSSPGGITCPGTCAAPFQQGATVVLTATAASSSTFTGWTGACTGTGGCSISLGADTSVGATFTAGAPVDSCAGLLPTLPAPQTVTGGVDGATDQDCSAATSDGAGNVYISAFASTGSATTSAILGTPTVVHQISDVDLIVPLQTGFVGATHIPTGLPRSDAYAPDGTKVSSVLLPGSDGDPQTRGLNANGGSIVLTASCSGTTGTFNFLRFDDANAVTSNTNATVACAASGNAIFFVMVDLMDNTLVVNPLNGAAVGSIATGHFAARWFDKNGTALTDWFDAGTIGAAGAFNTLVRPLIGGGAAIRSGANWVSSLASGTATVSAAPASFEASKDAVIALGGKAYAMIPDPGTSGTLDVVAASDGKSCGALATTAANTSPGETFTKLFAGKDGTLISLGGASDCSANVYPQVLK